ncbi:sulfur carrier protein ThiS [Aminiphilus circumscriptus]|jgi:sulfur carrier protein|uniref:sulfur carrier protein ThiS n=1 Tax=Aminiphilus circumscriptus TaxID=290732 RepID=UPI0004928AD6|nr:sulfur carrier protein ThiS [Aminiphilus circumscriptus]
MITVNGDTFPWRPHLTVQDVIAEKRFTFPMLAVWIDDVPIPRDRFAETLIQDGSRVQIIHMISGG